VTFTPRPAGIFSLTVDPASAPPNGTVTVAWDAEGDTATLDMLTTGGVLIQSLRVPIVGSQRFVLNPANGSSVVFKLTVRRGTAVIINSVAASIVCDPPWFFNAAPASCPTQGAQPALYAYQQLERGYAIYSRQTNQVFFLSFDRRLAAFPNIWTGGVAIPPPANPVNPPFTAPTAEIGYAWSTRQWPDGRRVSDVIGGAVAPSFNYTGQLQYGTSPTDVYITFPDGTVYWLQTASGLWTPLGR
jgi:hypothetical protein